jgi:2-methylisocitrate lyase-like PEP mutase family enzyme
LAGCTREVGVVTREEQARKAEHFLALHTDPGLFILPNAWDAASAKIYEIAGFRAVGTTSAGIAHTLGYPDGQVMSLEQNLEGVRRIVDHVDLPVSADVEAGYSASLDGVVNAARGVVEAGAVGLNLEDRARNAPDPLFGIPVMIERIRAIRQMALREGIHLVVNIRTDVYLVPPQSPPDRLRRAVERGNAYREAGADCIFVPDNGGLDGTAITTLAQEIDAPLNIIAGAHTPPIGELEAIGVKRVSLGPRPMQACLGLLRRISLELLNRGSYALMTEDALAYEEVNGWFGASGRLDSDRR